MRRVLFALAIFFLIPIVSPTMVEASIGNPVTCHLLTQPVTIDGKWTNKSEWNDTVETKMPVAVGNGAGYFRMKHDATTLYILGESLVDTALEYNSTAEWGDFMSVFLDTLYNQGKAPQTDDYRFIAYYVSASNTTILTRKGDGTQWVTIDPVQGVQAMVGLDSGNSPHGPHPHVTFEMSIPLSLIPASQFGFFMRLDDSTASWSDSDATYTMHFYWPYMSGTSNQGIDPSSWGTVTISSVAVPELPSAWLIMAACVLALTVISRLNRKTRPLDDKVTAER